MGGGGGMLMGVWRGPGRESGTDSSGRNGSHKQAKPSAHEGGLVGWLGEVGHSRSVLSGKTVKKGEMKTKNKKGKVKVKSKSEMEIKWKQKEPNIIRKLIIEIGVSTVSTSNGMGCCIQ